MAWTRGSGPLRRLLRAAGLRYQVGMPTRYLPGMAAGAAAAGEGRLASGEPGPGLDDLEPTLALIEAAYAAALHG